VANTIWATETMSKHCIWSESEVLSEANKYSRKVDFKRGNYGAYQAACRKFPHILSTVFRNRPSKYTEAEMRSICSNYDSLNALSVGHRGASEALRAHFPKTLRDELFERKIKPPNYWTKDTLLESAANYETKEDFYRGNLGGYSAAVKLGILNDLGFKPGGNSDYDIVYIWRADGQFFNNLPLYKVGVTSFRLGESRIRKVAQAVKFRPILIAYAERPDDANTIEKLILQIGHNPLLTGFDGCSEFRAMRDEDVWLAIDILRVPKSVTVRPGSPWPIRFT